MIVDAVLGTKGAILAGDVSVIGSCVVALYGMVKVAYQKRMGKVLDTPLTRWLDIGADVFSNALGALNKALVASGKPPLLPHPDVVAAEARADRAESRVAASHRPTLPGVPPPHVEE